MTDQLIGENIHYLFYSDRIYSKMTGKYLKKYWRSGSLNNGKGWHWSQLKKYETIKGKIITGGYLIRYPLTIDIVEKYLTESRPPTDHQDSASL
jgi:hypothetical protein